MAVYLPNSGSINLNGGDSRSVNNIFGAANGVTPYGNNLLAYVGRVWYKADTSRGTFTAPVTMPGDFYGKGPISPVSAGGYRFYVTGNAVTPGLPTGFVNVPLGSQSGSFIVPLYSLLTITIYGGAGGGAGGQGYGGNGSSGGDGTGSTFGSSTWYVAGSFGTGGTAGSNGTNGTPVSSYPQGGAGGGSPGLTSGGSGGNGGRSSITVANPVSGIPGYPNGPSVGSSVSFFIGAGGSAGSGGASFPAFGLPGGYNGGAGQWGWIDVGWE